jgi:imidazoleglycerol-phosphate dehydratase
MFVELGLKIIFYNANKNKYLLNKFLARTRGVFTIMIVVKKNLKQLIERRGRYTRSYHGFPISVEINLDGSGKTELSTGIGFLDHLLDLFARYGSLDLTVICKGDLRVDDHHTVDEVAMALGGAINKALASQIKSTIRRNAFYVVTMDECLTTAALDLCGRSSFVCDVNFRREKIGELATELIPEIFIQICQRVPMTLIVKSEYGVNDHHKAEGLFKAVGAAFKAAIQPLPK